MGILNVTPDSFSDGGSFPDAESAAARGLELAGQGADIVDIGGESSRPGARPVTTAEELGRVLPVIRRLVAETDTPISIDTTKAEVARQALVAGAQIVNDISALGFDGAMASVVAASGAPVVLMHMRGTPETMQRDTRYGDLMAELAAFFRERIGFARAAGIAADKIIIDPGIGFGKSPEDNLVIMRSLPALAALGHPVLVGPSRKACIGGITGRRSPAARDAGTAGAVAVAAFMGAHMLRVHSPALMRDAALVAAAIRRAGQGPA